MYVIDEEVPQTEHFSYAEITWKIKNISIALCPKRCSIKSDEFQISGHPTTTWRLTLDTWQNRGVAILKLELIGTDATFRSAVDPQRAWKINCSASILDCYGDQSSKYEKQIKFKCTDCTGIEAFSFTEILKNQPCIGPDDLTIRLRMIVHYGYKRIVLPNVPISLLELSRTFYQLLENPLYPDIVLLINDKKIYLNKAMFSHVSGMGELLNERQFEVRLLNHCDYSIGSIFRFMYTGDINHIIGVPFIRVAEDIERFQIEELAGSYPKEIIPLNSTIDVAVSTSYWRIRNFESIKYPLDGHEMYEDDGYSSRWKVTLYPKEKRYPHFPDKNYVFLEATLLESTRETIDVNIEFSSMKRDEIIHSRRNHKRMNVGDKIKVPFFLRYSLLMSHCLIEGDLFLRITLRISTTGYYQDVGEVIPSIPFLKTSTVTMIDLAQRMRELFANPKYWDLNLVCGDHEFKVHRFVLASRSSFFKKAIQDTDGAHLNISDFDTNFFAMFLEHLYNGLYRNVDFGTNCHMYELGFLYNIPHLITRYMNEIDFETMLMAFEYAHYNNLMYVRHVVLSLINNYGQSICVHDDWNNFFERRPDLAVEIASAWRD